jgi:tetratricopeptide (TPR) repeat protein
VRVPPMVLEAAATVTRDLQVCATAAGMLIDRADLPSVVDLRQALRAIDRSYGDAPSTSLLPVASRHLSEIALLARTALSPTMRHQLDTCEAEAATLMGQLVWDASQRRDHDTARAYFDQATAAAQRTGDRVTAAHACLRKSFLALYGQRDAASGLLLAQQAAQMASGASHTVSGLALLHAAEAHAMRANSSDCDRALAAADSQLSRIDPNDSAAHLFAGPEFDRLAGSCYLSLGRYQRAQSTLAATAARLMDRPKSQAIVLGNLALTQLRQREVDAAAATLQQAIDITAPIRGGGGLNLIFVVGRELGPWRTEPVVQHVHDRLHDLMIST